MYSLLFEMLYFLGTLFATGAEDGSVILWSINSLNAIKKFEGSKDDFLDSSNSLTLSTSSSVTSSTITTFDPSTVVNYILVLCQVRKDGIPVCTCTLYIGKIKFT